MKKYISVMLSVIICLFALSPSAFAAGLGEQNTYTYPDGTVVHYYLDETNMPYVYEDGEKIGVVLPLEHLKVTDENILAELNSYKNEIIANEEVAKAGISMYAEPKNYVDISNCEGLQSSPKYTRAVTFATTSSEIVTKVLKLYDGHNAIRLKMYNIEKAHLTSSTNISYKYYYYSLSDGTWYSITRSNCDCTKPLGDAFRHSPGFYPYGRFHIIKNNNLKNFDIDIWTTTAY